MVSFFLLIDEIPQDMSSEDFLSREEILEILNVKGNFEDFYRSSLTMERKKGIPEEKLRAIYEKNKRLIANFDIKFVVVILSDLVIHFGGSLVDSSESFLERKFKEYGIRNYEVCKPVAVKNWGYFSRG